MQTSTDPYFRERTPWRVGTVKLDAGPVVVAHLHGDTVEGDRVRLEFKLDKSGSAVAIALPAKDTENMADDPHLREMTCDPKFRRVLITDGRNAVGQAMAKAFSDAGASIVFVGLADAWKPFPGLDALRKIERVEIVPLDVTDTESVTEQAEQNGARIDIIVNTAEHVRSGGVVDRHGLTVAREEMDIRYLGLLRLAQAFGPVLRSRGADGVNSAAAFVNLLSVHALMNWPAYGSHSATEAACLSAAQCMRAELRPGGVKVLNVFFGPLETEWFQTVPPPKVSPAALASAVIRALQAGRRGCVRRRRRRGRPRSASRSIPRRSSARWQVEHGVDRPLSFARAVSSGEVRVVDLTQTLAQEFPTIVLPPELGQCAPFRMEEVSRYDERGPAWYWNNISLGEHTGTHFDAPIHWITGKDLPNNAVDTIDVRKFIAPACVIDCSKECAANPDFALTIPFVEEWEARHGRIEAGSWVLLRTDWSKRTYPDYAGPARRRRAHAGSRARRGEVVCRGTRRAWLRHRNDRHRFRPGPSLQSALSGAFLHARQGAVRAAVPDQSRSAAAQGRGHHRGAAQDQAGIGQPVARSGAGRGRREMTTSNARKMSPSSPAVRPASAGKSAGRCSTPDTRSSRWRAASRRNRTRSCTPSRST